MQGKIRQRKEQKKWWKKDKDKDKDKEIDKELSYGPAEVKVINKHTLIHQKTEALGWVKKDSTDERQMYELFMRVKVCLQESGT